jgi:hypothetical protein
MKTPKTYTVFLALEVLFGISVVVVHESFTKPSEINRFRTWCKLYLKDKSGKATIKEMHENYVQLHKMFECEKFYNKNTFRSMFDKYLRRNEIKHKVTKTAVEKLIDGVPYKQFIYTYEFKPVFKKANEN